MAKISLCDRCQFYSNNPYLICALHPDGVTTDNCDDYSSNYNPTDNLEEQWCPDGYVYYDEELIKLPDKPNRERQLWLWDNHPAFTGICGNCGYHYPLHPTSWHCPECATEYD